MGWSTTARMGCYTDAPGLTATERIHCTPFDSSRDTYSWASTAHGSCIDVSSMASHTDVNSLASNTDVNSLASLTDANSLTGNKDVNSLTDVSTPGAMSFPDNTTGATNCPVYATVAISLSQ